MFCLLEIQIGRHSKIRRIHWKIGPRWHQGSINLLGNGGFRIGITPDKNRRILVGALAAQLHHDSALCPHGLAVRFLWVHES
jgi:hypothetical protein